MIMRKVFNSLSVIIAAMVTFAGCAKQEIDAPATVETKTVQFFAESIETKTHFGEKNDENKYPTLWDVDDKVKVLLNLEQINGVSGLEKTVTAEISSDAKSARFVAELNSTYEFDAYTFYAIVPSSAYNSKSASDGRFTVIIPEMQQPQETSVDKSAQVLYAVSSTTDEFPSSVPMNFKHFAAYGKLSLVNLNDKVSSISSVKLSFEENVAGKWNYLVADGSIVEREATKEIVLNTTSTEDIWFACAPVDMSNKTLTLTVTTDKGDLVKEITFPENRKFEAGKIAKFTVNMEGIGFAGTDEPEQPGETAEAWTLVTDVAELTVGDKVVIAAADENYALGKTQNNNNRASVAITKSGNVITVNDDVQVITLQSGTKASTFAFQTESGYLYAASSSSNHLKTQSELNENGSWSIEVAESGVATIKAQGTNSRNWLRFNTSNSPKIFSCYGSGQTDVALYRLVCGSEGGEDIVEPDTTPSVQLEVEELELAAEESEGTIEIEAKNITSIEVRALVEEGAQDESDWLVAEYDEANSSVAYSAEANESEVSRTAYIEVYCLDADGNEIVAGVSVTQVGVATENEIQKLTVAEFIAAEVDENVYYELEGTITRVDNTTYGNFDLTDDTGTVYIYGLCSEDGATNKYWATSGAKLGDDIVIRTIRADFNGNPQGKNAWFVSLKSPGTRAFYTLDTEAVDFTSEGGSKDVTVTAYNTTAAVTASSDNAKFTVSVNGYKVTISSTANDLEEVVSGNITIKVGDLVAKTVKVTLAAKPASGVVEGGQDDFHTISSTNTSYVTGNTTAGWNYKNCAILKGGTSDSSPAFKMIGDASNRALCMNGKTSAVGSITSPTLTTGCGTLKFNYGLPFSDTKIKFRVDIKQGGTVVKTFTVENSSATKYTKYSHEVEINVAGDFQIVFTNLSPSNSTSNKDRTAVWDVEWTGYKN